MIRNWFIVLILASFGVAGAQTTAPATLPATGPAALAPPDASTPKGALRKLFLATAAGDEQEIRSLLYTSSPIEEKLADTMAQLGSADAKLHKASKDLFGEEKTAAVLGGSADAANELIANQPVKINGDLAVIELRAGNVVTPIEFQKAGNTWKLRVGESIKNKKPDDVEKLLAALNIQVKVFGDLATDVAAGKFKSVEDVKQTRDARVRQAVMQYVQDHSKAATQPSTEPTTKP